MELFHLVMKFDRIIRLYLHGNERGKRQKHFLSLVGHYQQYIFHYLSQSESIKEYFSISFCIFIRIITFDKRVIRILRQNTFSINCEK